MSGAFFLAPRFRPAGGAGVGGGCLPGGWRGLAAVRSEGILALLGLGSGVERGPAGNERESTLAVRIRLKKFGRRHQPAFRLAVMDARRPRDGKVLEEVGLYQPDNKDEARRVLLVRDRIEYWLGVGAQPSDTVRRLLDKQGITKPAQG